MKLTSKKIKRIKEQHVKNASLKKEKDDSSVHEIYGKKTIINLLSNDQSKFPILPEPLSSMSLFERKEKAKEYFEENKYNLEDLLNYDNTNKNIQKQYLKYTVNLLNKVKDFEMKNIIKEKIKKCGIILSKLDYEEEINSLNNDDKNDLLYIDYKSNIITCLKYIKKTEGENIQEAREILNIKKKYNFNQEAEIGESNYYFYLLALHLNLKLDELSQCYFYYEYIIDKFIDFLTTKNLAELLENDIYILNYITHILIDRGSIGTAKKFEEIKNFLDGESVNPENLENAIRNKMSEEQSKIMEKEYTTYKLNFDANSKTIDYFIYEDLKIDGKDYKNEYKISYPYEIFNNEIINTINYLNIDSLDDFESKIFKNILCDSKYSETFYKEITPEINKIVKKILNSNAAIKYFNDTYKKKYPNLEYHFNNENVQNIILEKIIFYPIFKRGINSFTNPMDMSIYINSIPGEFSEDSIPFFNKKIMNIGRIVLFLVHEIIGPYMRRYYSYLTNREISMDMQMDNEVYINLTGGSYIEDKFLGFKDSCLYLRNALSFFYYSGFDDYPIVKGVAFEFTEEKLRNIINDNPTIFDFILYKEEIEENEEEDDDNNETFGGNEENMKNKITFNQYYNTLKPITNAFPSFISCGRIHKEYISL